MQIHDEAPGHPPRASVGATSRLRRSRNAGRAPDRGIRFWTGGYPQFGNRVFGQAYWPHLPGYHSRPTSCHRALPPRLGLASRRSRRGIGNVISVPSHRVFGRGARCVQPPPWIGAVPTDQRHPGEWWERPKGSLVGPALGPEVRCWRSLPLGSGGRVLARTWWSYLWHGMGTGLAGSHHAV